MIPSMCMTKGDIVSFFTVLPNSVKANRAVVKMKVICLTRILLILLSDIFALCEAFGDYNYCKLADTFDVEGFKPFMTCSLAFLKHTPPQHGVVCCCCYLDGDDRSSVCFWLLHNVTLDPTALSLSSTSSS